MNQINSKGSNLSITVPGISWHFNYPFYLESQENTRKKCVYNCITNKLIILGMIERMSPAQWNSYEKYVCQNW